uniref:Uncharacterized protein n=1 Tax=Ciona savignyi TaxID=51511 RepID=H2Y651_CIOSA
LIQNNAYYEEERINARNFDQAERLRLFQRATQKRVTQAANLLQKNAVQEVSKKIDEERAILHRSVSAAERSTPKKNRCFYNIDQITIDGGRGTSSRKQVDPKSKFMNDVDIDVKSKKASTQRKFACQKLTEKVFESSTATED